MSRITSCFETLKGRHRKALIPYIMAGDPDPGLTVDLMHTAVEAGADIIELGVPFSDPMADGPVIQKAAERALQHGVSLRDVLAMVTRFREQDGVTPVVLMGYLNPIEVMGYGAFAEAAANAGIDGALTVDLPPEEAHDLLEVLTAKRIDPIFLLAPTTDDARIKRICQVASGYVYYVSLKGVTGAATLDTASVAAKLEQIRRHTTLPVGVGFGIKDAQSAAAVAKVADAVVVGSALIQTIVAQLDQPTKIHTAVKDLLSGMRQSMDKSG